MALAKTAVQNLLRTKLLNWSLSKVVVSLNIQNSISTSRITSTKSNQKNDSKLNLSYAFGKSGQFELEGFTIPHKLNESAKQRPEQICYKYCLSQKSVTFLELKQQVDELAQSLLNLGFQKGDRLAVLLPNIPETNLTILAAASIGVVVVLLNPAYQLVEIEYMLKKTKAKGIVMLDNLKTLQHYEILKKICPELESSRKGELHSANLPELKHVIVASLMPNTVRDEHKYKGTWSFNEIQKYNSVGKELPYIDIDDPFAILFTAHSYHIFSLLNMMNLESRAHGCYESNRISCIPIPIFHIFGLGTGTLSPITNQVQAVFPNIFPEPISTMKAIQNEKCTALKGSPVIFFDILNHPERKNFNLSSLEYMLTGASLISKDLLVKLKESFGLKHQIIIYGMTESTGTGTMTTANDLKLNEKFAYESVGRPLPFTQVKIADLKTGEIVSRGVDGEICIRGFGVMKGYLDDPEKTAETIDKNGWLKTGDIACMDEHDYVYYKSRAKELVIRGGVNIYPSEIERFLRTHKQVLDCYVFGVPDERHGEELCAWIKLRPEAVKEVTAENIKEFCKGNIAYFKIPKYIKFVDSFPVNATGKVQKFKMLEQMKSEMNSTN